MTTMMCRQVVAGGRQGSGPTAVRPCPSWTAASRGHVQLQRSAGARVGRDVAARLELRHRTTGLSDAQRSFDRHQTVNLW